MKTNNRFFLIGYNFNIGNKSGEGMVTITTEGRFPSSKFIRNFVCSNDKLFHIDESMNVVIQNIFEFKNESDYNDFIGK